MTSRAWSVIALLVLSIVAGSALWLRCEGNPPDLRAPEAVYVGREGTSVAIGASDVQSGVHTLKVVLRHAGGETVLFEREYPGNPFTGGDLGPEVPEAQLEIDPKALGLREGGAFLVVDATDWSWARFLRGNTTHREIPLTVDLHAPRVSVGNGLTYVRRGGSGSVVYRLDEEAARDGVEVDDRFFPGVPLPGADEGARFALFGIARDVPANPRIQVVAEDRAGNRSARSWPTRLQERSFDDVPIRLSQRFMETKVPELASALGVDEGSRVADFQKINREVRAANEARIREIVKQSVPEKLWEGAFEQLRNSAVTSRFAEHRTYFLDGEQISEAIHYGYDLASLAGAPVGASNAGRVIFADDLGIYGNCVILDHGQGLSSLYAHLSRIDVTPGDAVAKGETIGLSGETGLAGGDHLHFAILVRGVYVDPVEWWDQKWVREHVEARLEAP